MIFLPLGLVIVTGILLMLKKEFDWIQPPTQKGVQPKAIPTLTLEELFASAREVPELEMENWADLDRVDVKSDKGVVKFVGSNRWEVQVDTTTGEVLQVAYRRSDLIESLHDGSFFVDWTKHNLFLPSGVLLLVLWFSGIYLFVITQAARARKTRRLARVQLEADK